MLVVGSAVGPSVGVGSTVGPSVGVGSTVGPSVGVGSGVGFGVLVGCGGMGVGLGGSAGLVGSRVGVSVGSGVRVGVGLRGRPAVFPGACPFSLGLRTDCESTAGCNGHPVPVNVQSEASTRVSALCGGEGGPSASSPL